MARPSAGGCPSGTVTTASTSTRALRGKNRSGPAIRLAATVSRSGATVRFRSGSRTVRGRWDTSLSLFLFLKPPRAGLASRYVIQRQLAGRKGQFLGAVRTHLAALFQLLRLAFGVGSQFGLAQIQEARGGRAQVAAGLDHVAHLGLLQGAGLQLERGGLLHQIHHTWVAGVACAGL